MLLLSLIPPPPNVNLHWFSSSVGFSFCLFAWFLVLHTSCRPSTFFVYVLSWETVTLAFQPYGEIKDCSVVIDRVTGKANGFWFLQLHLYYACRFLISSFGFSLTSIATAFHRLLLRLPPQSNQSRSRRFLYDVTVPSCFRQKRTIAWGINKVSEIDSTQSWYQGIRKRW